MVEKRIEGAEIMVTLEEQPLPEKIKFIFCNYLGPQEVICHRTGKQISALVSEKLKDSPEKLLLIKKILIRDYNYSSNVHACNVAQNCE
jgi:hypothetical protein